MNAADNTIRDRGTMGEARDEKNSSKKTIYIDRITEDSENIAGLMDRCPITGAYCSHRNKIIRRKVKRHKGNEIMIFMVMHYTPITDTIYRWLFKDLIRTEDIEFEFTKEKDKGQDDTNVPKETPASSELEKTEPLIPDTSKMDTSKDTENSDENLDLSVESLGYSMELDDDLERSFITETGMKIK